jgi:hypothetical protein
VKAIVDAFAKYHPSWFTAEKDKGWESLDLAIRKLCLLRNVPLPVMRWITTNKDSKTALQKARRIKKLELPLSLDMLWFRQSSSWDFDAVVAQFVKMDGGIFVSSNSHRKLDAPDAISLAYEQYFPRSLQEQEPEDPKALAERKNEQEEEFERARRQSMRDRMFGNSSLPEVLTRTEWERRQRGEPQFPTAPEPQQPRSGFVKPFPRGGGVGAVLPPGMRGGPKLPQR